MPYLIPAPRLRWKLVVNSLTNRWQSSTLYPGRIKERERERGEEGVRGELLLAVSVLQIKMRIEVDENLLTLLGGSYDPDALLGGRVGAGIPRRGQVVRAVDVDAPSAFICSTGKSFRVSQRRESVNCAKTRSFISKDEGEGDKTSTLGLNGPSGHWGTCIK